MPALLSFRIQEQSRLRDAIQSVMAITDASNWFWQRISVSGIALKDALPMRYERSHEHSPKTPLCPSCAQVMRFARITSRFGDLPDVYTFECWGCGVTHIEAAYIEAQ